MSVFPSKPGVAACDTTFGKRILILMGSRIRVLPPEVVNQIAAGEVVERPASVLKELLENAVDAGATRIDVEVVAGGRKLVAVRDNGHGMNRDDALLAIEPHATSKIRALEDLERITTLGFRGEALAAIASVSRLRLTTRPADEEMGSEVLVEGGRLRDVRDSGGPVGTSVEVRDLFFNVPARRKFLRSQDTELAHVKEVFLVQALARPDLAMSLKVDGREIKVLAGGGTLADRLADWFGREYVEGLQPVAFQTEEVSITGFAGRPDRSRPDRNEQYFFVNGRATSAPVLHFALREAYRTLLPADRHPSVFLFLTLDGGLVDVNVHPAKREVRFRHSDHVRDAVIAALRAALGVASSPGSSLSSKSLGIPRGQVPVPPQPVLQIDHLPSARVFAYPRLPTVPAAPAASPGPEKSQIASKDTLPEPPDSPPSASSAETSPWSWCRVLGQVGGLYVVLETEDGLVLMDPHAAHERVLFERFMAQVASGQVAAQPLVLPETVELSPADAARLRRYLPVLTRMGFAVAEFGADAFLVEALPVPLAAASPRRLLLDVCAALDEADTRGAAERQLQEAVARAACRAAVRARDRLTLEEIEQLVIALAGTDMPYTCPHGRPTLVFQSFKDIARKFGRS